MLQRKLSTKKRNNHYFRTAEHNKIKIQLFLNPKIIITLHFQTIDTRELCMVKSQNIFHFCIIYLASK